MREHPSRDGPTTGMDWMANTVDGSIVDVLGCVLALPGGGRDGKSADGRKIAQSHAPAQVERSQCSDILFIHLSLLIPATWGI